VNAFLRLLLCLASVGLVSCSFAYQAEKKPDGSSKTGLVAKVGGKSEFDGTGDGMKVKTDDEASLKVAAGSALSYGLGVVAAEAYQAIEAGKQVTARAGISAASADKAALLNARSGAVQTLGANPEANPEVIKAAAGAF
jgi:hypothetical protein